MKTTTTSKMTAQEEFVKVYADAQDNGLAFVETEKVRTLTWKGNRAPLAEVASMYATIKSGYNVFHPAMISLLLAEFPRDLDATPAREFSVALYLHPKTATLAKRLEKYVRQHFNADEVDWEEGTLRVWWD